jgi:predicted flap endonuclease-1-like 5' DNA nuclease
MSLAFRILYAAFGKGTHHKLALDALDQLTVTGADAWQAVFLAHAARFVEGAKAPDDTFKDFTNHVLHPRDKFWGGAPAAATVWYAKTVAALSVQDWDGAVYSAGVLSHYVTDPLMPFHTGQSEAENNIHRAAEWSINRAYDDLRREGLARTPLPHVELAQGTSWLTELVRASASRSNQDYERLIAHYDITRGVVDPPTGLDPVGRRIAGDLLVLAATTVARVLDRALAEAGVAAPQVNLVLPALIGALSIPKAMILKRLADAEDRRVVEAMYDELMATGRVEKNLPADDRMVKERHAAEVLAPAAAPATPVKSLLQSLADAAAVARPVVEAAPIAQADPAPAMAAVPAAQPAVEPAPERAARARLSLSDELDAAPSIGPKTAERLAVHGIKTVADFLNCDPERTARALQHSTMDAETLKVWQQQAQLVLDVPGLNGTQARLLTGAGYLTARDVASADAGALCAAVLRYAASGAGQQILRNNAAPDAARITTWIEAARLAA